MFPPFFYCFLIKQGPKRPQTKKKSERYSFFVFHIWISLRMSWDLLFFNTENNFCAPDDLPELYRNILRHYISTVFGKKINTKYINLKAHLTFQYFNAFANVFINACKLGFNRGVEIFLSDLVLWYALCFYWYSYFFT